MSNPHVTRERVEDEVKKALGKALRKDAAAIRLDQSVTADLGGTSLDFLDVTFRVEQAFGIRMAHQVVLDHVEETFGEGKAIDSAGRLTRAAVELLKQRLGADERLRTGMYADEVATLVTAGTLVRAVEEILQHLPAACTHCSAKAWKSPDGARVLCGACEKEAAYPDGDSLTKDWLVAVEKERGLFAAA